MDVPWGPTWPQVPQGLPVHPPLSALSCPVQGSLVTSPRHQVCNQAGEHLEEAAGAWASALSRGRTAMTVQRQQDQQGEPVEDAMDG